MSTILSVVNAGIAVVGNSGDEWQSLSAAPRISNPIRLSQFYRSGGIGRECAVDMLRQFHEGMGKCFPEEEMLELGDIEDGLKSRAESEFDKRMIEFGERQQGGSGVAGVLAAFDVLPKVTYEVIVVHDNSGERAELAAGAIHYMVRGEDPGNGQKSKVYGWIPYLFTMPGYREQGIGWDLEHQLAERTKKYGGEGQFLEIVDTRRLSPEELLGELEFYNPGLILHDNRIESMPPDEFRFSCVRAGEAPFGIEELSSVMPDLLRDDGQEIFTPDSRRRFWAKCGYQLVDMQYASVGFETPYCLCYRPLQSRQEDPPGTLGKSEVMAAIESNLFWHDDPRGDSAFQGMQQDSLGQPGFWLASL